MQLFRRKNTLVQAFRLPMWGENAAEIPPKWLVQRFQTGELEINCLGGVSMPTPWGLAQCAAGDVIVLYADDSIGFEKPEAFATDFEPVTEDMLQIAA